MVLQSVEDYWLLLKNKQSGKIKIIPFHMNDAMYQAAEAMLKKAEQVNRLVQIGEMPSADLKISDPDYCSECEFFDTCLPDLQFGPGATVLTAEEADELEAMLNRREELKPDAKEFDDLDDEIKRRVKTLALAGVNQIVAGDWLIDVKEQFRKGFTVKEQTIQKISFARMSKR